MKSIITMDADDSLYVMVKNPKVINPHAIVVKRNGEIVGTVSAEYDFSQLPPEQHEGVLSLIATCTVIHDCT